MSKSKCTDKIHVNLEINEDIPIYYGLGGCQGAKGPPGHRGPPGNAGNQGMQGYIGPIGLDGPAGPEGTTGITGPTGNVGPSGLIGPVGPARTWFLSGETGCLPFDPFLNLTGGATGLTEVNQIGRDPIPGDLLLSLEDCGICEFSETTNQFESTNLNLTPCLDCDQLAQCLKDIKTQPDLCSLTLTLANCPPLFKSGTTKIEAHRVKEILAFGETCAVPEGTFCTPEELGELLEMVDWQYTNAFETYIYLTQKAIPVPYDPNSPTQITFEGVESGKIITHQLKHQCQGEICFACQQFNLPQAERYLLTCTPTGITGLNNDGRLTWTAPECLGVTGPTGFDGVTGPTGLRGVRGAEGLTGVTGPTGPTFEEVCECLTELEEKNPLVDCQYQGIVDPACLNFLNQVGNNNTIYYVATALIDSSPPTTDYILGPSSFKNQTELIITLNAMSIQISPNNNLVIVSDSPELINAIIFLDSNQNPINLIKLETISCCPEVNTRKEAPILTKIGNSDVDLVGLGSTGLTGLNCTGLTGLAMIPAECVLKPDFDLPTEICQLPPCQAYRCCLEIDATEPFLLNKTGFPWFVHEIILFDNDLTNNYSDQPIYGYTDWVNLLESNGWTLKEDTFTIYQYCANTDTPLTDTTNLLILKNVDGALFHCQHNLPKPTCTPTDTKNIQIIIVDNGFTGLTGYSACEGLTGYTGLSGMTGFTTSGQTGLTGVKLASPDKILDAIPPCSDICYICTTTINTEELINSISIVSPWEMQMLVLAGNSQPIITTQFSSALQLETILINLGWTNLGGGVYSQTVIQPIPNSNSYLLIGNCLAETEKLELNIHCQADCSNFTVNSTERYIFTRLDEGHYCWMHPNCFNDPMLNQDCCPGTSNDPEGPLGKINDCDIIPKYDLRLELTPSMISIIQQHFCSKNGPYWISGYKVRIPNPDFDPLEPTKYPKYLSTIQPIDDPAQIILQPFGLKNLTLSLEALGWLSDPESSQINDKTTTKVSLILNNSDIIITGVCLNLYGENGQDKNSKINYVIPLHTIDRVECHQLPRDAMILLKNGVTPGFTGTDCPLPTGATAGSTGCTGFCLVDLDCVVPTVPPPINLANELCELDDCVDCCTGMPGTTGGVTGCGICYQTFFDMGSGVDGATGFCEHQPFYQNCITIQNCDIEIMISQLGDTNNLQIVEYHTADGNICTLQPPQDIGINPTLMDLANALINVGWVTDDDISLSPIEMTLFTCRNIKYVVINQEGGDPLVPPYPYHINGSCIILNFCPSTDRDNQTLIKKSDGEVCWTQICQIEGFIGSQGEVGATGMTGCQGETGFDGDVGAQPIVPGPMGPQGYTGPPNPDVGPPGVLGHIGDGIPGPEGPEGPEGPPGAPGMGGGPPGPTGPAGMTGQIGDTGLVGPTSVVMGMGPGDIGDQGPLGPQGNPGPTGSSAIGGAGLMLGSNTGMGDGEIFAGETGMMPSFLQFRTLQTGPNITVVPSGMEIDIGVNSTFDWGTTTFTGGTPVLGGAADIDPTFSLTFNNGATLFTDSIEETTSDNGVIFDTSGGTGLVVKDGGVELQNDLLNGTDGPVTRPEFMDFFQYGSFDTQWRFFLTEINSTPIGPTGSDFIPINWQRLGNVVTLFLPEITDVPTQNMTGGSVTISNLLTTPIPDIIKTNRVHIDHIVYDAATGPSPAYATSMLRINGNFIEIQAALGGVDDLSASAGFTPTDFFSRNIPKAYTYYIFDS